MAVAEETLRAIITIEDRTASALRAIGARLAAFAALPQHISHRFKELGEETGLAEIGEHAREAGEKIKGLHERVSGLIPALGGLGALLSVGEFAEAIRSAAEYEEQLAITSRAAGLTATQLGGLQFAGNVAGVSTDQIDRGIQYFNRQISEAALGKAKDAQTILTRMGFANNPQHMVKTAAGLDAIADEAKKLVDSGNIQLASDMMGKLFGSRSGVLLLPMFQQGAHHLHELMERAAHFGLAPSDEDAARGKEFNESLKDLTAAVGGFRLAVAGGLFPVLTPVIERMAEWIAANRSWIATDISEAVRRLIDTVENADWRPAIWALKGIGHAAALALPHLGAISVALLGLAAWRGLTVIASIASIGTAAVRSIGLVTAAVWGLGAAGRVAVASTGIGLIAVVAYEIYENWSTIEPLMEKLFANLAQAAKVAFGLIGKYGTDAVNLIWDQWKSAADWLTAHVPAWVSKLWMGGQGGRGIGSPAALPPGRGAALPQGGAAPYAATPAARAFLKALAAGEAKSYDELYGGGSLKGLPTDQYGFPLWAGKMGPSGISHAAGLYQFEPKTWDAEAAKLGLKNFSAKSQDIAAWDLAATTYAERTHRDLAADLSAGRIGGIAGALHDQWTSASPALTRRLSRDLASLSKPIGRTTPSPKTPKMQGRIDVTVNHHNPPPGTTARVTASGSDDLDLSLGPAFAY